MTNHEMSGKEAGQINAELNTTNASLAQSSTGALNLLDDAPTAKRRAEQAEVALRASEARYRSLVELSPDAIVVVQDGRFVFANTAAQRLHGYDSLDQIMGLPVLEIVHPDDRELVRACIERALRGEEAFLSEARGVRRDGRLIVVEFEGALVDFNGSPAAQVILRDISERKQKEVELRRLNRTLEALSKSGKALMRAKEEGAYLQEICRIVVRYSTHEMAWIGFAEHDPGSSVRPVACAGSEDGYLETLHVTWDDTERGRGPTGTAIRTGRPCGCSNMLTDPQFGPWRDEATQRGYASSIALPLRADEKTFGALNIYSRQPCAFSKTEVQLLSELADDLAYGITSLRLRAAHARTEALSRLADEQRRLALEAGDFGTWEFHLQTGEIFLDNRCRRMSGFEIGEKIELKDILERIHERDLERVRAAIKEATAPTSSGEYAEEYRVNWPDGSIHWVSSRGRACVQGEGKSREELRFTGTLQDITVRKRAEQTLRENEEELRLVLDQSNDAIFWADPDTGTITRCNRKAAELTERSPEELIGIHQSQLHPPDQDYAEMFRKAALVPKAENIEAELVSRTGRRIPVLINSSVVTIGQRRVMQGVFRDVTQRRRNEEALRESEERFRALFEQAAVGVALIDTWTGRFVRTNRKFWEIVGYSQEEILALTIEQITHPDDVASSLEILSRLRSGEAQECSIEKRYLQKSGAVVWVSLTASPLWRPGEEPVFHIVVVYDITARKRMEAEVAHTHADLERKVEVRTVDLRTTNEQLRQEIEIRRQREQELKEAERRYQIVADYTYDWEYWQRPDGALVYCSPSCERVTGYTASELAGRPELLEEMVHSEDKPLWQRHVCAVHDEPGPKTLKFRISRKQGDIRWLEHICQPIIEEQGASLGVRATNRDVTDRQHSEMIMQNLHRELAAVSRITMVGQLSAALAHELNQPLGAIVCNVQAAQQFLSQPTPVLHEVLAALADIEADGKRAGEVIRRLRAMYQRTGQRWDPLNFNRLICNTIELLNSECVLRRVRVDTELVPELPNIVGNSIELQQVLINLILNALDAMTSLEPESRELHIGTACEPPRTVRIWIRDFGTGLSIEQLGRLGEPFFTTKPNGMGMGLAISRSIIEAHGGKLGAFNHPDRGATFWLSLPAVLEGAP